MTTPFAARPRWGLAVDGADVVGHCGPAGPDPPPPRIGRAPAPAVADGCLQRCACRFLAGGWGSNRHPGNGQQQHFAATRIPKPDICSQVAFSQRAPGESSQPAAFFQPRTPLLPYRRVLLFFNRPEGSRAVTDFRLLAAQNGPKMGKHGRKWVANGMQFEEGQGTPLPLLLLLLHPVNQSRVVSNWGDCISKRVGSVR